MRSGSSMAQILPSNVLEEQTVIVGPQYAERLIHHSPTPPPPAAAAAPPLPQRPAWRSRADQQITDHPLLVCWYLKHLPGDFRSVAVCCGGVITLPGGQMGGALISQSAPNALSAHALVTRGDQSGQHFLERQRERGRKTGLEMSDVELKVLNQT